MTQATATAGSANSTPCYSRRILRGIAAVYLGREGAWHKHSACHACSGTRIPDYIHVWGLRSEFLRLKWRLRAKGHTEYHDLQEHERHSDSSYFKVAF